MAPILSVEGLSIGFRTDAGFAEVVHDVSFAVERGKTLCIVGESGSGKSVTCQAILGLLARNGHRTGGRILFEGRDLCALTKREMEAVRGKGIGMVFQDPLGSLNPVHTVGRQLRETLRLHTDLDEAGRQSRASCTWKLIQFEEDIASAWLYNPLTGYAMRKTVQ